MCLFDGRSKCGIYRREQPVIIVLGNPDSHGRLLLYCIVVAGPLGLEPYSCRGDKLPRGK